MFRRLLVAVLLVLCGLSAGLVLAGRFHIDEQSQAAPGAPQAGGSARGQQITGPGARIADFSDIAARAVKGVVNVSSLQVVRSPRSPLMNDPFFRYFFGDEGDQDQRSMSLGSGVIISSDGLVVTNNHVIGDDRGLVNREINAVLPDKRQVHGRLIGTDPMTDIALFKIDVANLPVVAWGDSSKLRVGQWVLAIGSPFQLNQTVTLGIVSAVGRAGLGVAGYEDFIQTDAAINPGNSGGALIDANGELVGINTAIYSESGGYQGIGFSVPSNLARRVVDELLKYGSVRRGSIGVLQLANMTPELAEQLGVKNPRGILVYNLTRAVYNAGLRRYDVITAFNGEDVNEVAQLQKLIADAKVGSTATLAVIRDGRSETVKVPIVEGTAPPRRQMPY